MPSLIYTGQGYRPDLPARDIDAVELAAIAKEQNASVPELVERARSSGLYQIIAEPDDSEIAEPKSLDEMSKDELRAACKDIGVSQAGSKDEMIARIRAKLDEAPEINAEDVPE
jgi:hypothetical protein